MYVCVTGVRGERTASGESRASRRFQSRENSAAPVATDTSVSVAGATHAPQLESFRDKRDFDVVKFINTF